MAEFMSCENLGPELPLKSEQVIARFNHAGDNIRVNMQPKSKVHRCAQLI